MVFELELTFYYQTFYEGYEIIKYDEGRGGYSSSIEL